MREKLERTVVSKMQAASGITGIFQQFFDSLWA